jgi:hypothetical protein
MKKIYGIIKTLNLGMEHIVTYLSQIELYRLNDFETPQCCCRTNTNSEYENVGRDRIKIKRHLERM